ncbi:MAG: hypothetical protein EBX49_04665 [Synechococcaceae bacterium WB8_1B_136]|nr:hypothetical protein [Synechococcaceae bacterium WB8_1B_136]
MTSTPDLDEAYRAVERTYSQGLFAEALVAAEALLPQLSGERSDQLLQRLQLLIGHIHLYGLQQPQQALAHYQSVSDTSTEAPYRTLAQQGIALCAPEQTPEPNLPAAPQPPLAGPAMPWLTQLSDPEAALQQSAALEQSATLAPPAEVVPPTAPASPSASEPEAAEAAASPWQEAAAAAAPAGTGDPATSDAIPHEQATPPQDPSPAEDAELARGLRRIVLR